MSELQEYVSVQEAVRYTGKSDKTIRLLIKELLEVQHKSLVKVPELLIETKGDNNRQFYKISLQYLKKRFQKVSISTVSTPSSKELEVELLHNWLEDKAKTVECLTKELQEKNSQVDKLQQLLENQQKMTLHGQLQVEKAQLLLEEKSKGRKKVLGLF
jgi:hypothetical protein